MSAYASLAPETKEHSWLDIGCWNHMSQPCIAWGEQHNLENGDIHRMLEWFDLLLKQKKQPEKRVRTYVMREDRTNKLYQKIKEIVASGELGEIRRSQWMINSWWRPDSYYQQSAWRATWGGEGGGVLVNQAPHQLDLWQWICGIPVKVFSKNINGCHRNIGVENDVTMLVEFANGATGTFTTCTHDAIGTDRLEIDLDGGKIVVD